MSTRRRERPPSTPRGGRSPVTTVVASLHRPEPSTATVSSSQGRSRLLDDQNVRRGKCSPSAVHTSTDPATGRQPAGSVQAAPRTTTDQRFRWSEHVWSPPPESNRRPHPYHGTTGNRCADRRFPRSRSTVRVEVIGSLLAKVCAHFRSQQFATRRTLPDQCHQSSATPSSIFRSLWRAISRRCSTGRRTTVAPPRRPPGERPRRRPRPAPMGSRAPATRR
jgi:hypothetical protein